jgi:hypothetical protein
MMLGPIQLRKRLGLPEWQFDRGRRMGLIPDPDRGRWADDVVADLTARIDAIVTAIGSIPDCGSYRAAEHLSVRFGQEIPVHVVFDLHRLGLLPVAGDYKGAVLYSGRALESFNDAVVLERALLDGQLFTTDQAVSHLRIRRSDFGWLLKLGLLAPAHWGHSRHSSAANVALYREADLERLLADDRIDWDEVRSVPSGGRSVLAGLKEVLQ